MIAVRWIAALTAGALASCALAACGGGGADANDALPPDGSVVIAGTAYDPTSSLRELIATAARDGDANLTQRDPATDAQQQLVQLRRLLPAASGLHSVVVGAIDPAATERLLAARKPGGPAVISLLTSLRGARATITLDPEAVSERLTRAATSWARRHGGIDEATVLVPPDPTPIADWSVTAGRAIATALIDDLSDAGFSVLTLEAVGTADARAAVSSDPSPVVIGWNDATALGAVGAASWVGAAGSPAPTSAAALDRLDLVVGARLDDLAEAIVRSSGAAAGGKAASGDVALPVRSFAKGSPAARAATRDYAG